jgi:ATP-dependent Zn protease
MSDAVVKLLITWLPFIILIAVWVFFMRKVGGGKAYRDKVSAQVDAQLDADRDIARHLDRIATALEQRKP